MQKLITSGTAASYVVPCTGLSQMPPLLIIPLRIIPKQRVRLTEHTEIER